MYWFTMPPHTLTADMGFGAKEPLYVGAGIAVTYWVFSFSQVFFPDQIGRRRPLIVGEFLQALSFLCVGTPLHLLEKVSLINGIGWASKQRRHADQGQGIFILLLRLRSYICGWIASHSLAISLRLYAAQTSNSIGSHSHRS
jgi:hypothetical protein